MTILYLLHRVLALSSALLQDRKTSYIESSYNLWHLIKDKTRQTVLQKDRKKRQKKGRGGGYCRNDRSEIRAREFISSAWDLQLFRESIFEWIFLRVYEVERIISQIPSVICMECQTRGKLQIWMQFWWNVFFFYSIILTFVVKFTNGMLKFQLKENVNPVEFYENIK